MDKLPATLPRTTTEARRFDFFFDRLDTCLRKGRGFSLFQADEACIRDFSEQCARRGLSPFTIHLSAVQSGTGDIPTTAGFVILVALAGLRAWFERRQRATGYFATMARVEIGFIALMLLSLVGLGCVQILLRNAFHSGLIWADPLMRHLVLWLGAFGAALASARMRHISVDALSRLLPERFHPLRRFIVYVITAIAGYLLVVATVRLVLDERQYPEVAFLGIQTWMLEAVLPIAFAIITYRTLVGLFLGRESAETQIETESEA